MLRIFQSCGTGCKLLTWSDTSKQGDGYGSVSKAQDDEDSDDPFEDDSVPDIVFAQPYPKTIWSSGSLTSPIVKSKNNSANNLDDFNTPIFKKPSVKDVTVMPSASTSTVSNKQSPIVKSSIEKPSPRVGVHTSAYSKSSPEKKPPTKDKEKKEVKEEAEIIQMVSVV